MAGADFQAAYVAGPVAFIDACAGLMASARWRSTPRRQRSRSLRHPHRIPDRGSAFKGAPQDRFGIGRFARPIRSASIARRTAGSASRW